MNQTALASAPVQDATPTHRCAACGSEEGRSHTMREMMFGTRDQFTYRECDGCGRLWLIDPPSDWSRYYPSDYYSLVQTGSNDQDQWRPTGRLRTWLYRKRNEAVHTGRSRGIGGLLAKLRPRAPRLDVKRFHEELNAIRFDDFSIKVLDVGCGQGALLRELAKLGFPRLVGADPYLQTDVHIDRHLSLFKRSIEEVDEGEFDLIMFHHSLEHIFDHHSAMRAAADRLAPGGTCLVRIPLAGSGPWRKYGPNYVEVDAPRHFVLHTVKSFELVVVQAGLIVERVVQESAGFGYWASELYCRDIPLRDPVTRGHKEPTQYFSKNEMAEFDRLAQKDNAAGEGGRAAFILRKPAI